MLCTDALRLVSHGESSRRCGAPTAESSASQERSFLGSVSVSKKFKLAGS